MRADGKRIRLADDTWVAGASAASGDAPDRVAAGIAARFDVLPERVALRETARRRWEGRRVLYVLPVLERGGGSNVVLSEARAMTRMGVETRVFNLAAHRAVFERSYPAPGVPVVYGREADLVEAARGFDAVIGTAHYSIPWMLPLAKLSSPPVLGYCIQDYEPLFYAEGSEDFRRAFASYGLVPGMKRFSKSKWNADEVDRADGSRLRARLRELRRGGLPPPPARAGREPRSDRRDGAAVHAAQAAGPHRGRRCGPSPRSSEARSRSSSSGPTARIPRCARSGSTSRTAFSAFWTTGSFRR